MERQSDTTWILFKSNPLQEFIDRLMDVFPGDRPTLPFNTVSLDEPLPEIAVPILVDWVRCRDMSSDKLMV